jgi:putative transposase
MECLDVLTYHRGDRIKIPKLGSIRCRGRLLPIGKQKGLRIVRRESGWYAQIILDNGLIPIQKPVTSTVGIDVGLESFATLSNGEKIDNPRFGRRSERKQRSLQRRLCRRPKKRGMNRRKAAKALARHHERVAAQRRSFAHQEARKIVSRFELVGFENLNVVNMVKNHKLARSIADAAWGFFLFCLTYKAESAGRRAIGVDPHRTSQTCPNCGAAKKKVLKERDHVCPCGLRCHRDHAAARVILARALAGLRGDSPVEEPATVEIHHESQ